jgi:hypothetical protein
MLQIGTFRQPNYALAKCPECDPSEHPTPNFARVEVTNDQRIVQMHNSLDKG